jgi:hypothetical protein
MQKLLYRLSRPLSPRPSIETVNSPPTHKRVVEKEKEFKDSDIFLKNIDCIQKLELGSHPANNQTIVKSIEISTNIEWNVSKKRVNTPSLLESRGLQAFIQPA